MWFSCDGYSRFVICPGPGTSSAVSNATKRCGIAMNRCWILAKQAIPCDPELGPDRSGSSIVATEQQCEPRHEHTIGSYPERARSRILYRMKAAEWCVLVLAGLAGGSAQLAPGARWITSAAIAYGSRGLAVCTAPPAPGATRTVPAGHAKPSSFAPRPRSHGRAYGAPIPRPIVSKHVKHKRRTAGLPPSR